MTLATFALDSAPATFVVLVACILLVGMRAVAQTAGITVSDRVVHLLTGAIAVLLVLFVLVVALRFGTLA